MAELITPWLLPLALATLASGALGALASRHLRGQVAYLVVASAGSLLAAFGLSSAEGIAAGLYYLPHTTFAAAAAFLIADAIAARRGELADRLDPGPTMAGHRILGSLFFVTAMAIVGLPPLSGFLSKFLLLRAAQDHAWLPGVMTTVLMASLFTLISLARSGSLLFYRTRSAVSGPAGSSFAFAAELTPVVGLLLLVGALSVAAGPAAEYAQATANQLLQPYQYIHAVLGGG